MPAAIGTGCPLRGRPEQTLHGALRDTNMPRRSTEAGAGYFLFFPTAESFFTQAAVCTSDKGSGVCLCRSA